MGNPYLVIDFGKLCLAEQLLVSRDFYYFGFLLMKNTEWKYWVEFFFLHAFSEDVFHTIFDSVLLKDSAQISRYFISFTLSNAAQQMIASLEHLALSYFGFVFWSPSHESAFNYFWPEICTARVCLAPRSVTSVIKKKRRDSRQVRKLNNYISSIWCWKLLFHGLFYSRSTLERVRSFLKKILQTINLAQGVH